MEKWGTYFQIKIEDANVENPLFKKKDQTAGSYRRENHNTWVGKYRMTLAWLPLQKDSRPSSLKTLLKQSPTPI